MSASNSSYFFAINDSKVYTLANKNNSNLSLVSAVINPRPFQTLEITSGATQTVIPYWRSSTESKSILDQKENLKKRMTDNLLSDIMIF